MRIAAASLGFPPRSTGGDSSGGDSSNEAIAKGVSLEGDSEGGTEGVGEGPAEDIPEDGERGEESNGDAVVWNRVKLVLGGVCIEKVVEKAALGRTVKGAMAVSCEEVRQRGVAALTTRMLRLQRLVLPLLYVFTSSSGENTFVALFPKPVVRTL